MGSLFREADEKSGGDAAHDVLQVTWKILIIIRHKYTVVNI